MPTDPKLGMKLRPSQIETLAFVATFSDGVLTPEVAEHFGITIRAAEGRLDRLAMGDYLAERQIRWLQGRVSLHVLTERGSQAIADNSTHRVGEEKAR